MHKAVHFYCAGHALLAATGGAKVGRGAVAGGMVSTSILPATG
ncbi:hypothetical protein ABC974_18565 [Sphingomonas oligophenolica]|uniref:Uncharacterized protein n=1 Tax=Sphingomonas oligophenolica TaxID=301154 RepID=A0ABU9Y770_9SPHN